MPADSSKLILINIPRSRKLVTHIYRTIIAIFLVKFERFYRLSEYFLYGNVLHRLEQTDVTISIAKPLK
jgi:hypothetical protein